MKATIESRHISTCSCGFTACDDSERGVTIQMLNHIKSKHKVWYKKLIKLGRKEAMCQNGRGYYDDGKSQDRGCGWFKATETFREAHTGNALYSKMTGGYSL